jgi:hypothetical protein
MTVFFTSARLSGPVTSRDVPDLIDVGLAVLLLASLTLFGLCWTLRSHHAVRERVDVMDAKLGFLVALASTDGGSLDSFDLGEAPTEPIRRIVTPTVVGRVAMEVTPFAPFQAAQRSKSGGRGARRSRAPRSESGTGGGPTTTALAPAKYRANELLLPAPRPEPTTPAAGFDLSDVSQAVDLGRQLERERLRRSGGDPGERVS